MYLLCCASVSLLLHAAVILSGLSFFLFSLSCELLVHKYPSSELSREAMGMVLHKDSKWYQQWKDFKDNNVVFNSKCSKGKVVARYFLWSDSCHVGSDAIYATSLNIMQIRTFFCCCSCCCEVVWLGDLQYCQLCVFSKLLLLCAHLSPNQALSLVSPSSL